MVRLGKKKKKEQRKGNYLDELRNCLLWKGVRAGRAEHGAIKGRVLAARQGWVRWTVSFKGINTWVVTDWREWEVQGMSVLLHPCPSRYLNIQITFSSVSQLICRCQPGLDHALLFSGPRPDVKDKRLLPALQASRPRPWGPAELEASLAPGQGSRNERIN